MSNIAEPRKKRKSYNTPNHAHALTFSTRGRRPYLLLPGVPEIFLNSLDVARHKLGFDIWSYVVMPEHVHVIVKPREENYSMAAILKAIKAPCVRQVFAQHPRLREECLVGAGEARFWLAGGGYDRNVFSAAEAWKQIHYVHDNPFRRGLCEDPNEWPWSSLNAYRENETFIPVDLCDWQ